MDSRIMLAFLPFILGGARAALLTVTNRCPYTVWAGVWTDMSSPKLPQSNSGFVLQRNTSDTINVPAGWAGRMWGRTHCTPNAEGQLLCLTGDCNSGSVFCGGALPYPPVTYITFNLAAASNVQDSYDVDVSVGFNVPVSVIPSAGMGCGKAACPADVNAVCPRELRVVGDNGATIACQSACQALNDNANCCAGEYSGAEHCKPTNYSQIFKSACPMAMSYPFDNGAILRCSGGSNYLVTFCPYIV